MPIFSFIIICIPSLQLAISYLCLFFCWDNYLILQIGSYLSFAIFLDNTSSWYSGMEHDFDFQAHAVWVLHLAMIPFTSNFLFPGSTYPLVPCPCVLMKYYLGYLSIHLGWLRHLHKPDMWSACCPVSGNVGLALAWWRGLPACKGISLRICHPGWRSQPFPPLSGHLCHPPTGVGWGAAPPPSCRCRWPLLSLHCLFLLAWCRSHGDTC